jgi:hypothetical protein
MFFLKLEALASAALLLRAGAVASRRPNIIMILTDDQDAHMNSLDHMPFVQKYLIHEGTQYTKHYCTIAVCCPSRATILTGMAAHNTNVTDIIMPYGKSSSSTCTWQKSAQYSQRMYRRLPKMGGRRPQRQLSPHLAPRGRLRDILRREALQPTRRVQL